MSDKVAPGASLFPVADILSSHCLRDNLASLNMSFGGGSIQRNRSKKSSAGASQGQLIPASDLSKQRRPHNSASITLIPRTDLHDPAGDFVQHRSTVSVRDSADEPTVIYSRSAASSPTKGRNKKANQWKRWTDKVIPALLQPFMRILEESQSLREHQPSGIPCQCGAATLDVICVYFQSVSGCFALSRK